MDTSTDDGRAEERSGRQPQQVNKYRGAAREVGGGIWCRAGATEIVLQREAGELIRVLISL